MIDPRVSRALLVLTTLAAGWCRPAPAPAAQAGSLYVRPADEHGGARPHWEPYCPRPGDLVFFSDNKLFWRGAFALAGTGRPFHTGIVVAMPDGSPGILEAGAFDRATILVIALGPRLRCHEGKIWIRRLRQPISPEQSHRLTEFGLEQTTKGYAVGRILLELTPLGAHGRFGARLFGTSSLHRRRWFCSELVVAAAATVGLFDPEVMKPNTIFPRDLFIDQPCDLRAHWEPAARWSPCPEEPPPDAEP
jgi:hypothetical protein